MKKLHVTIVLLFLILISTSAQNLKSVVFKTVKVDGLDVFYREAGDPNKATILLLHGFPSSSHMYRDLINDLSNDYHLIAPDYIGHGQSSAPHADQYDYTFNNLATVVEHFIDAIGLKKYSLYMFDIGGPIGFRIAVNRPGQIQSIIIQNTTVYPEGADAKVAKPVFDYTANPNPETEKGARQFFYLPAIKWLYTDGAENVQKISPDGYVLDYAYVSRPGADSIQLEVLRDYGSNFSFFAKAQEYLKNNQPNTLVVSGKNDKIFIAAGADLFKKNVPNTKVSLLNGGHFVLEEKHREAAELIKAFLKERGIK